MDQLEDNQDLFMEWVTLFSMVMKLQKVPIIDGNLEKTATYVVGAYHRYLESRGVKPK